MILGDQVNFQKLLNYVLEGNAIRVTGGGGSITIDPEKLLTNPRSETIPTGTNPKQISLNADAKHLWLSNPSSNTANFHIGINNSVTATGNKLAPGEQIADFPVDGLSSIWVYTTVLDEAIDITEFGGA